MKPCKLVSRRGSSCQAREVRVVSWLAPRFLGLHSYLIANDSPPSQQNIELLFAAQRPTAFST